jgi:predicted MFS family arabinose efflux permease
LAPASIPIVTVVLWSVAAIPTSVFLPALSTVFQKAVSARRRARMIGGRWALLTVVSAVCIPLVGIMSDSLPFPVGYQIAFLLSFAGAVMSVVYFSRLRLPPFSSQSQPSADRLPVAARVRLFLRPLTESRLFVRYNAATLVFRLAMFVPSSLFSLYWVNELSATDTWIGLRGGLGYLVLAVGYIVWGRWANELGHRNMLLVCGVGLGLYTLLTASVPAMQWLLPVAAVWGISQSGLDIGLLDMMLAVCPEGRQPSFVAAANVLISLSAFLGPLLGAAIAQTFGLRNALWVGGGLEILGALLFLWLPRQSELLPRQGRIPNFLEGKREEGL